MGGRFEIGDLANNPVVYEVGSYVTWKSKIYRCLQKHVNVEPGIDKGWQKCWVLLVFSDGKPYFLPDDARVKVGNFHYKM